MASQWRVAALPSLSFLWGDTMITKPFGDLDVWAFCVDNIETGKIIADCNHKWLCEQAWRTDYDEWEMTESLIYIPKTSCRLFTSLRAVTNAMEWAFKIRDHVKKGVYSEEEAHKFLMTQPLDCMRTVRVDPAEDLY